jgi:hypothetical protein
LGANPGDAVLMRSEPGLPDTVSNWARAPTAMKHDKPHARAAWRVKELMNNRCKLPPILHQ